MTKLISHPADIGIDPEEIALNPGAIREVHEDVLRDLMTTSHPLQRNAAPTGAIGGNRDGSFKPRRRTCV